METLTGNEDPQTGDLYLQFSDDLLEKLGWEPEITLDELIDDMMKSDIILMKKDKILNKNGYESFNYFE